MSSRNFLFTSESVSEGHPDLVADQIADAIKDEILREDPQARTGIEVFLPKGVVHVGGEVTTSAYVDIEKIVRETILDIGYDNPEYGLDGRSVGVINSIVEQSPEIAGGVFNSYEVRSGIAENELDHHGAGDQGMEFGSAQTHNKLFFPAPFTLARLLTSALADSRKSGYGEGILLPDAKSQVTIGFENGKPKFIDNILISSQHTREVDVKSLEAFIRAQIIEPTIQKYNEEYAADYAPLEDKGRYLINPAGAWHIGGPASDAGLTGRKLQILIGNGAWSRHGGGNASGKDGTKTDASAAVYTRWVAKHLVAAGLAKEIELQVAYAIGSARPLSVLADTKGEEIDENILNKALELFDFRPAAIFQELELEKPIYREASRRGYLGREEFAWEKLTKLDAVREVLGK